MSADILTVISSVAYWSTTGEMLVNYWSTIGQLSVTHRSAVSPVSVDSQARVGHQSTVIDYPSLISEHPPIRYLYHMAEQHISATKLTLDQHTD